MCLRKKSYITKEGYRQVYCPKHPDARENGYISEHKKNYEKKYGPVPAGKVIHHKNGNKLDNRPENLIAISPQEHYKIHNQNRKEKSYE